MLTHTSTIVIRQPSSFAAFEQASRHKDSKQEREGACPNGQRLEDADTSKYWGRVLSPQACSPRLSIDEIGQFKIESKVSTRTLGLPVSSSRTCVCLTHFTRVTWCRVPNSKALTIPFRYKSTARGMRRCFKPPLFGVSFSDGYVPGDAGYE